MADLTIAELREIGKKMTPGPWKLWDGNSWRRIGSESTGKTVIEPTTYSRDDPHPDLAIRNPHDAEICTMRNLWDSLLDRLEAAEQPWVEVTERLPEESKQVFIITGYDDDGHAVIRQVARRGEWFEMTLGGQMWCWNVKQVKYWRTLGPLPLIR